MERGEQVDWECLSQLSIKTRIETPMRVFASSTVPCLSQLSIKTRIETWRMSQAVPPHGNWFESAIH